MTDIGRKRRVFLDLTHLGRHVTGIERISIEQFGKVDFADAEIVPVRSSGVLSMILRQQILLPLLALIHPRARFVFPGFPPSPFFALIPRRVILYVHDTFLITRRNDLSTKARLYMAPQFAFAVRRLKQFFVNSEKTRAELAQFVSPGASIKLYRPAVANVFALEAGERDRRGDAARPLRLASLGTVEPRKNYAAAIAILDALRGSGHADAELHIIGRAGWGPDAAMIAAHPGVIVHGYLAADAVKTVLETADAYLCTSHDEGLGLPLLEAQYAGLPIVAPDQPVFREVLGASGMFIDPAEPALAARAVAALMAAPGWRGDWAKRARANISRWNAAAEGDLAQAKRTFAAPVDGAGAACPASVRAP